MALYFAFEKARPGRKVSLLLLNALDCKRQFGWSEVVMPAFYHAASAVEATKRKEYFIQENQQLRYLIDKRVHWPLPLAIPHPDSRMQSQEALFVADCGLQGSLQQLIDKGGALYWEQADEIMVSGRWFGGAQPFVLAKTESGLTMQGAWPADQLIRRINFPADWRNEVMNTLGRWGLTRDAISGNYGPECHLDTIGVETKAYIRERAGALT